jgi:predicted dehydrogenase
VSAVHIAILGTGRIARLHSRIAKTLGKQIRLSYASRSLERAEQYRRSLGGVKAYGSYEAACADPDVDAIFDCTPHALRVENARLAARYRKHLLMEKPVARTLAELADVERAVSEAGILAMVAENYYFKPLVHVLRGHLQREDIGQPMFLDLRRAARSGAPGWRQDPAMMGGGALLEGGVHWVNLLLETGGPPVAVVAVQPKVNQPPRAPHEDSLDILVQFASGAVGRLLHSWNVTNRIGGLGLSRLSGTDGNIHFESNGLFALVVGRRTRLRFPGFLDLMGFRGMLRHFADCVQTGTPPKMSLTVARRDLALVLAAYRSLETGRVERINLRGGHASDHESRVQ